MQTNVDENHAADTYLTGATARQAIQTACQAGTAHCTAAALIP
ncbi:MAG: hypothetical protein ACRDTG_33190 [Pseudonocardiaceae bacterium]